MGKYKKTVNPHKVKLHFKKGDMVEIISGDDKGKRGTVLLVIKEKMRAIVQGYNMVTKHIKPGATGKEGEIVKKEASIHVSNLMLVNPENGLARRTGFIINEKGEKVRVFKEHTSIKK